MFYSTAIIFTSFSGLLLSLFLFHKKRRREESFICPLRGKCHEVIHSEHSKFLGVPVEIYGIGYYAGICIGFGLLTAFPLTFSWGSVHLLVVSVLAFLFSLYLTFIQVAVLRRLCTWCLLSASFCTVIAGLSILGTWSVVSVFTQTYQLVFFILSILAMTLGVGSVTLMQLFLYAFLKDRKISHEESLTLQTVYQVMWFALGLVLIAMTARVIANADFVLTSASMLAQGVALLIVIVSLPLVTLVVIPRLIKISSGLTHKHTTGELEYLGRIAFLLGPILFVSWYGILVLEIYPVADRSLLVNVLSTYGVVLCLGIIIGQLMMNHIAKKAHSYDR